MLGAGIKRIRERRDGHDKQDDKVTMSMAAFVYGMVKSFEGHLPQTNPGTPLPAKKWLYKIKQTLRQRKLRRSWT